MTGAFTPIDLSKLPAPDVVETLDFEVILQALKTDLLARNPALADVIDLESEPAIKLLEDIAYRELLLRQRINEAAQSVMLAYSSGNDLDNLGAFPYNVERQLVDPGDPNAVPPVAPTYEDDERFRTRIQLALEGFSTAGPDGAYIFHGLSVDPQVKDISVDTPDYHLDNGSIIIDADAGLTNPQPGDVAVTVLSTEGDGTPSASLIEAVTATFNNDDIRPLTDHPRILAATIVTYTVSAMLYTYTGPDPETVRTAAEAAVTQYVQDHHRLGHDITLSGLYAALHQPGVQRVQLDNPLADLVIEGHQAAYCTAISVALGGIDE